MKILIVGGGQVGASAAKMLQSQNIEVKIIERRHHILEKLYRDFSKDIIIEGSGSDPDTLQELGIHDFDAVFALTGSDEVNLVVANVAKFEFAIPKVIARINSPRNAWLFDQTMGVDKEINQSELLASYAIEQFND